MKLTTVGSQCINSFVNSPTGKQTQTVMFVGAIFMIQMTVVVSSEDNFYWMGTCSRRHIPSLWVTKPFNKCLRSGAFTVNKWTYIYTRGQISRHSSLQITMVDKKDVERRNARFPVPPSYLFLERKVF